MISSVLFYIISALILLFALKMVFSRNLVHSALFMVAVFVGIAFIYVMLEADYMAIVQIMVYVGAISVLFVFGVMLTRRDSMEKSNQFNRYRFFAGLVAATLMLILGRIILMTAFIPGTGVAPDSSIYAISLLLLNDYAIPFEVSGILLLTAMIGAIIIGKGVKNPK